MAFPQLARLNRILERDSTDTSYKYALLRAVADICQRHKPYAQVDGLWYRTGYLVEKWIEYYYPLIESDVFIPQKNAEKPLEEGKNNISFRKRFKEVTDFFKDKGGFKIFWVQYKGGEMDPDINDTCVTLAKEIWYTITRYPMKHLGYSVENKHYGFFNFRKRETIKSSASFSQELLIKQFGSFWIEKDLWQALRYLGSYISGDYSIVNKWVQFSVKQDRAIEPELVYRLLNTRPESERDVHVSKEFFEGLLRKRGSLECVWTDRRIRASSMHVDHVIPFSVWRNNDLWNLLPAHSSVNMKKSDMIPSLSLLEDRKNVIIGYWEQLEDNFRYQFNKEINISLLDGNSEEKSIDNRFDHLKEKCEYLIEDRGLIEWTV